MLQEVVELIQASFSLEKTHKFTASVCSTAP